VKSSTQYFILAEVIGQYSGYTRCISSFLKSKAIAGSLYERLVRKLLAKSLLFVLDSKMFMSLLVENSISPDEIHLIDEKSCDLFHQAADVLKLLVFVDGVD